MNIEVVTIKTKEGEEYLRQISTPVDFEKDNVKEYIKTLEEYCSVTACFAMAGVQLKIPKRIIYLKNSTEKVELTNIQYNEKRVLINPVILNKKGHTTYYEKCMSCDKMGLVNRPYSIEMEYLDEKGVKHTEWFSGFIATILSHEFDHLDGILHIDRAVKLAPDFKTVEERIAFRKEEGNGYTVYSKDCEFKYY